MANQEQIEEMAKVIPDTFDDFWDKNRKIILSNTLKKDIAKILYNAGYRKADEIRKEIAKGFTERLKQSICDNTYPYFDKDGKPVVIWNTYGFDKIDELLEQYGVDLVE